ncbi:MAG: NADH-quinone oxidoreductase subunit C [Elusimicrobia bacterium]|nr:NADH-quinone oxidoreductase subunit C [Elusimicrobiota bacterium]
MTNDELFAKIQGKFPKIEKAAVQVKDYLTVRLNSKDDLAPMAEWLKSASFDMLETVTATDLLGPVDMKGYIRQANFNPFLPEGATPQIESAPTAGYPYRPVMDLMYVFFSIKERARVFVRLEQPRENVSVPSLTPLFKSADWQERETFDLLGVRFEGHPNLTKILTPDFTQGHPLRKDYAHVKDRYDE